MNCRTISSESFIALDITYNCYEENHIILIICLILPQFLVYVLIIPSIIFTKMSKVKDKLNLITN